MPGYDIGNLPAPNGGAWNEVSFSELRASPDFKLAAGMVVTQIAGFGELDIVEDRAVSTIGQDIARRRGFQWPPLYGQASRGFETSLATEWRPRGFHGPVDSGAAYVLDFDEEIATDYRVKGHWQAGALCLPLLVVGVLRSRGQRLAGFAGSVLYRPQRFGNRDSSTIGYPVSRSLKKSLAADEINAVVAETNGESIEIARRLAVLAMLRPYSGGSMSGGKRS